MALIRDPAFWRRFSMAIHQDEEASIRSPTGSGSYELKQDTWLARQQKKNKRRTILCWAFWILLLLAIGAVVVVIWLLSTHRIKIKIGSI
ncbi:hypothetical protein L228DRAFT_268909 [Xylona heveae TC161]|uniref:Uncharacterized protein n=1 Tax=Xylona heveae (strain CBS 132557 / TC161) TaxID=1328760 RepID=A0A165GPS6_XYLHT|nr:hypothetical protein L228DRAFT_268909 [Xylona heveae TC161]KZF22445.1 hypothetical protein L228DRAFT_268909 [Xylona heveae TC161]